MRSVEGAENVWAEDRVDKEVAGASGLLMPLAHIVTQYSVERLLVRDKDHIWWWNTCTGELVQILRPVF